MRGFQCIRYAEKGKRGLGLHFRSTFFSNIFRKFQNFKKKNATYSAGTFRLWMHLVRTACSRLDVQCFAAPVGGLVYTLISPP